MNEAQKLHIERMNTVKENDFLALYSIAEYYEVRSLLDIDLNDEVTAIEYYTKLLPLLGDSDKSFVYIHHKIGLLSSNIGHYNDAIKHLTTVYSLTQTQYAAIDLAFAFVSTDDIDSAMNYLNKIDINQMDDDLKFDYYRCFSTIALVKEDYDLAKNTIQNIGNLKITLPIFQNQANDIKITLLDMLTNKKPAKHLLSKLREIISKYLILQPNFFGLGINLNAIISPKDPNDFKKK